MRAVWQGQVIAESNATIIVEGNHYFPFSAVNQELLKPSNHESRCSWKGTANYYSILVADKINENAAWYYDSGIKSEAKKLGILKHIAFWKGVEIIK